MTTIEELKRRVELKKQLIVITEKQIKELIHQIEEEEAKDEKE